MEIIHNLKNSDKNGLSVSMEKKNIIFITSIIHTPNIPLSYTNTRSVYNHMERFEQLKNTITSVRNKIPNNKIFIVECSPLDDVEKDYLVENSDIFLNLYDLNDQNIINNVYSLSKSLGEGTLTIHALKYLIENNIMFDSFYKLSGRYWLSSHFNYENFNNDTIVVKKINNDINNLITSLYKLPKKNVPKWLDFLLNSMHEMQQCIGAEVLFARFINSIKDDEKIYLEKIGVSGNIAVCGTLVIE
jgi:hypothetical protein